MKQFIFPQQHQLQQLQNIRDLNHLRIKIKELWQHVAPYCPLIYRFQQYNLKTGINKIHISCKMCTAHLTYLKNKDQWYWKCSSSSIYHNHSRKLNKKRCKSKQMQKASKFIQPLIQRYQKQILKDIVLSKFNISINNFNTVYSRIKSANPQYTSFNGFIKSYQVSNIDYQLKDSGHHSMILYSDQIMRQLFSRFGDAIIIETVMNQIDKQKMEKCVIIRGFNGYHECIIFGIGFIDCKEYQTYKHLLITFLYKMSKFPQSIIMNTDNNKIIVDTLEDIRRQKQLQYCIIKQQQLSNKCYSQNQNILFPKDIKQNQSATKRFVGILTQIESNEKLLQDINKMRHKQEPLYCKISKIIDKIKSKNLSIKQYHINQIILPKIADQQLTNISSKLSSIIFQVFYHQWIQSLTCDLIETQQKSQYSKQFSLSQQPISTIINVILQKQNLQCDCLFKNITGIPCRHIIKIAYILSINLQHCFRKRWIIIQQSQLFNRKRGVSKSTRSNMLK